MLLYSYGSALLTEDEALELDLKTKIRQFRSEILEGKNNIYGIELINGAITAEMIQQEQKQIIESVVDPKKISWT